MSLRRLCTRVSHAPGTARSPSWSAYFPSRPTHTRAQIPHNRVKLRLGAQDQGRNQHFFQAYSNYAPKGPPPHYGYGYGYGYGPYGQPPKPRASRLKDMAIGSVLTIAVYIGYTIYRAFGLAEEWRDSRAAHELMTQDAYNESVAVHFHHEKLIDKAEADDDGSPESSAKIHRLILERIFDFLEPPPAGPHELDEILLPVYPKSHDKYGLELVKERDVVILMNEAPDMDDDRNPEELNEPPWVIVGVNHHITTLGAREVREIQDPATMFCEGQTDSKFHEIAGRIAVMLEILYEGSKHLADKPVLITFFFRDGMQSYNYYGGGQQRVMRRFALPPDHPLYGM
ncbi:hypothetical protein F4808DRAFT_405715 [Astrocystis sublimbata]|nr:hypothetical protein F4808DRAFT_405715 [Astrocystis sublimbata]